MAEYRNRKVTVVGLGHSGEAAALLLREKGASVMVSDAGAGPEIEKRRKALERLGLRVETGGHARALAETPDLVVASPGIPAANPVLARAEKMAVPVWSEIELAARHCPAPVIAVTGTNGKSTVCSLLAEILAAAGQPVLLAGNIGTPFSAILGQTGPETPVVLELSSFQLEKTFSLRPRVAVLLNVTDDHRDRHAGPSAYRRAKARIFLNQEPGDHALVNLDDGGARKTAREAVPRAALSWYSLDPASARRRENIFCRDEKDRLRGPGGEIIAEAASGSGIPPGNILAAGAAALLFGAPITAVATGLARFRPLAHRMEKTAEINGVTYINDSKGTNPGAAAFALENLPAGQGRVVMILGGRDKGADFRPLGRRLAGRARAAVLLGEAGEKIAAALPPGLPAPRARDMAEAVAEAAGLAEPGDTVLLSPGCASFDLFRDYAQRGEAFREAVRALARGKGKGE